MTLLKLLKRWSELEPDRCKASGEDFRLFYNGVKSGAIVFTELEIPSSYGCSSLASVQACVQEAISSRNIGSNLTYSFINRDWRAKVGASFAMHDQPAIALLSAYIAWLGQSKEVTA